MKSYSEFMEYIKENVTDYLPERFESAEITIRQVVKNNDVALMVIPSMYLMYFVTM